MSNWYDWGWGNDGCSYTFVVKWLGDFVKLWIGLCLDDFGYEDGSD